MQPTKSTSVGIFDWQLKLSSPDRVESKQVIKGSLNLINMKTMVICEEFAVPSIPLYVGESKKVDLPFPSSCKTASDPSYSYIMKCSGCDRLPFGNYDAAAGSI